VELAIVVAGARRDMGQLEAALSGLRGPWLHSNTVHEWTPRLWYAYADTLAALGRSDEAREWFGAVVEIDEGETDAAERVLTLGGGSSVDFG
jgi:hypothetical protein